MSFVVDRPGRVLAGDFDGRSFILIQRSPDGSYHVNQGDGPDDFFNDDWVQDDDELRAYFLERGLLIEWL